MLLQAVDARMRRASSSSIQLSCWDVTQSSTKGRFRWEACRMSINITSEKFIITAARTDVKEETAISCL